jgi:hypothetical protein
MLDIVHWGRVFQLVDMYCPRPRSTRFQDDAYLAVGQSEFLYEDDFQDETCLVCKHPTGDYRAVVFGLEWVSDKYATLSRLEAAVENKIREAGRLHALLEEIAAETE